jgi:hypothetical protein
LWQLKQETHQTFKKALDRTTEAVIECLDDIFKQSQAITCKYCLAFDY